jgi:hypothetical protein
MLLIGLAALLAFIFVWLLRVNEVPSLPGSTIKIEEAAGKSDVIIVGKILGMMNTFPSSMAGIISFEYSVKVLNNLRGPIDAKSMRVILDDVPSNDDKPHNDMDKVGYPFIFFIQKTAKGNVVTKMVPASDENIVAVSKIVDSN